MKLSLVGILHTVENLVEDQLLERIALNVCVVNGSRVNCKSLVNLEAALNELIHDGEHGLENRNAEACNKMSFAVYGNEFLCSESVAVKHKGLHNLRHYLAL